MDQSEVLKLLQAHGEAMQRITESNKVTRDQLIELAQKMATVPIGTSGSSQADGSSDLVAKLFEYPEFKAMQEGRSKSCMFPVDRKTLITSPGLGAGQPLIATDRSPGIVTPPERRLFIRDVLPQATTQQAAVEFTQEATFTSAARPQGDTSPVGTGEGEIKGESAATYTNTVARVVTVAHWIPASVQIMQDAAMFEAYLRNRLVYHLKLKEEDGLLNGFPSDILGLVNAANSYNRGSSNDTRADTLRKSITQLALNNAIASAIVLHPSDLEALELAKDTTNQYIQVVVNVGGQPVAWRVPLIPTASMTLGRFLTADFNTAAQIWDRQEATVEISRDHSDFFTRNLVAIRCEERLALTIYRPASMIYGAFPALGT